MDTVVTSSLLPHAHRRCRATPCLLLAGFFVLSAHAEGGATSLPEGAARSLEDRALARLAGNADAPALPLALTVEVSPASLPVASHLSTIQGNAAGASIVDYRAWIGSGPASLGIGLTAAAYRDDRAGFRTGSNVGPLVAASTAPMLGLGLRYRVSPSSQLTFDSLASSRTDEVVPQVRVGMEFRSPPSQVLGIARGTFMRAQLSSSSQVSLNWRSGKLALVLRSQF